MKISTFFTVILFVAATSISCGGNSARTLRAADGGKPKMLWFDAEANFKRFASQDSIRYYLDRTVECGFNHIVVDVRPISGTVLYESDMLEPLTVVGPDTVRRDWDYLQCFLDEARKRELKVTVSTMIFPAGFTTFRQGAAYSDPELAGRTCVEYTPEGRKDIKDDPTKVAAFLNPVLPENQEYVLRFAHELLTKYKFDGYALDYCRFPDAESDFSPASRERSKPTSDTVSTVSRRIYSPTTPTEPAWQAPTINSGGSSARESSATSSPEYARRWMSCNPA